MAAGACPVPPESAARRSATHAGVFVAVKKGTTLRERFGWYCHHEPNTGCILWSGSLDGSGHGQISIACRMEMAHRVAWELEKGPIPEGLQVLHNCPYGDTPACVNPEHLFLGTHLDNHRDKARKNMGRKSKSGLPYGVVRRAEKFLAQVRANRHQYYLGMFSTVEEAHRVAVAAKRALLP
jgi:HNH endonuclease